MPESSGILAGPARKSNVIKTRDKRGLFTAEFQFIILVNPSATSTLIMNHPHVSRRNFIKTTALAVPFIASGCAQLAGRSQARG